ncbi:unnamed protein product [Hydatigera taeniaeformis]|uniref:Secreted protein n=1 Tax=Hydatigena taeniaeformis TaxID=6205 RepID=A0A0R3WUP5_HYDTA|nr:unnamed protein product [Hydatigera taeniaeformis]
MRSHHRLILLPNQRRRRSLSRRQHLSSILRMPLQLALPTSMTAGRRMKNSAPLQVLALSEAEPLERSDGFSLVWLCASCRMHPTTKYPTVFTLCQHFVLHYCYSVVDSNCCFLPFI